MKGSSADTPDVDVGEISVSARKKLDSPQTDSYSYTWIWVCLFLVSITWAPVFGIHIYRMSLNEKSTGTVVVVFPPMLSTRDLFRKVSDADGSIVSPVRWFPKMWLVNSQQSGFVGRLKDHGALGVYSTDFLSASALLSCIRIVASPTSSNPASKKSLAPAL